MQILLLRKNIDILFSLAMQEKSMSDFEKLCEKQVKLCELLHFYGISCSLSAQKNSLNA